MVNVMRGSKTKTLEVTLRNKNGTLGLIRPQKTFYNNILGAELKAASTSEDNKLGISHGIVVTRVGDDGIIKKGGISSGFIITEVNSKTVDNQNDLESALRLSKNQNNVVRLRGMYPNGMKISFEFML